MFCLHLAHIARSVMVRFPLLYDFRVLSVHDRAGPWDHLIASFRQGHDLTLQSLSLPKDRIVRLLAGPECHVDALRWPTYGLID
jgi:hypothetical protein